MQVSMIDVRRSSGVRRPAAIMLAIFVCAHAGCSYASFCENTLVSARFSPDGQFVAVVFRRNCGATTPFTTEVSVIRAGDNAVARAEPGNVFSMTHPPDSSECLAHDAVIYGAIETRLHWDSSKKLSISTPRGALIGRRVDRIYDVNIQYSVFE